MTAFFEFVNQYILGVAATLILLVAGVYLSVRLRFFHLRHPVRILRRLLAKGEAGGTSPFRALTVALAGTLGVGNIAGVALALASGGPGAVFWMWVSALAAMILKYAEIVLALRYRRREGGDTGDYCGGAMYYIREGLGGTPLARGLAAVFAFLCILNSITMGSVIQSNVIAESLEGRFGVPAAVTGLVVSALAAAVVCGGVKSISGLTVRLVPFMSAVYVLLSLYIILTNLSQMPRVLALIFSSAFRPAPAWGGILGFLFSRAVRFGISRGLLSNEAGCGTAPIAHAESNAKSPAAQGLWGIVEVFVDTLLLCSMTAFVILIACDPAASGETGGILLTIAAFETAFGEAAGLIICAAVFLFAYATIICWGFYGSRCVGYFTKSAAARYAYLALFCASVLFGAVAAADFIWSLADFAICAMMVLNTGCLIWMSDQVVTLSGDILEEKPKKWAARLRKRTTGTPEKGAPVRKAPPSGAGMAENRAQGRPAASASAKPAPGRSATSPASAKSASGHPATLPSRAKPTQKSLPAQTDTRRQSGCSYP